MSKRIARIIYAAILGLIVPLVAYADYPHTGPTSAGIDCLSCHVVHGPLPSWATVTPANIDDTPYNNLCQSCHNNIRATYEKTHSSINTSATYSNWTVECRTCHESHKQEQARTYGAAGYLDSGVISAITDTVITRSTGTAWVANEWAGTLMVIGDVTTPSAIFYKIAGNTATTLTLTEPVAANPGDTFAIVFGTLVRNEITYVKTGLSSTITSSVTFLNNVGPGSYADGTSTTAVCEVCHTQTKYHKRDGTGLPHHNGEDCIPCHTHEEGFKPLCNACHGQPPATGSHVFHATSAGRNYACDTCHVNSTGTGPYHDDGKVSLGFNLFNGAFVVGLYDGGTGTTYEPTNAGTIISNGGTQKCSNIYCHGSTLSGGTNTSPTWGDNTTVVCESCHGASASNPPTAGAHVKHAGQYAFPCASCHFGFVPSAIPSGMSTHVDNVVDVAFPTAGSYSSGNCSNLYCHSDGVGNFAAVSWSWLLNPDCTSCHGGSASAVVKIATNAHNVHINSASTVGFTTGCAECHSATVSSDTIISNRTLHVNQSSNVRFDNGTRNKDTDAPTYNGNPANSTIAGGSSKAAGSAVGSCANVYCHSSGNVNSAGTASAPMTFRTIAWNAAPIACDGCHGDQAGKSWPVYPTGAAGSQTANSHVKHVESSNLTCDFCHNTTTVSTVTTAGTMTVIPGGAHLNRTNDLSFKTTGGKTGTYAANTKTCSATYCHGAAVQQWGGPALTCTSCHDASNTGLSGRHDIHYNSASAPANLAGGINSNTATAYVFACLNCHPTNQHDTGPNTVNTQDANVGGAKIATYSAGVTTSTDAKGFFYTIGGSCTAVCHTRDGVNSAPISGVTLSWTATATGNCGICHNKAGDASPVWSAPHTKHINTYSANTNISCNSCHAGTATDNATINGATGRNQHPNGVKNIQFNAFANSAATGTAGAGCTNTYCHGNGQTIAPISGATISWSGTMSADCSGCHGGNASAATRIASNGHMAHISNALNLVGFNVSCVECHNATVSSDLVIKDNSVHVNKFVNVQFDNGTRNKDTDAPTYNGSAATSVTAGGSSKAAGSAVGSCANVYCHSSGNVNSAGTASPPMTFRTIAWNAAPIACDGCHGDQAGKSWPVHTSGAAGSQTANTHVEHVEYSGTTCDFCHISTTVSAVATAGTMTVIPGGAHLNRTDDVSFKANGGKTGTYVSNTKTCSATYCHGATSQQWGGAPLGCSGCHDASNTGLSGRHDIHYNSATPATSLATGTNIHTASAYVFACLNCHPTNQHTTGPNTVNTQDANVGGAKIATYSAGVTTSTDAKGFFYTIGGSCTAVCHTRDGVNSAPISGVTLSWTATATGNCGICHNKAGDASPVWSAPHTKHINTYSANTNISCNSCHAGTATDNATINGATGRTQHPNGNRDLAMNAFSTGGTVSIAGSQGSQTCSNTYCHSNGTTVAGTHAAISWSGNTTCASCHAAVPATGAHTKHLADSTPGGAITCNNCHNATASNNTTISNTANHVDKNVTINFNTASSGTTATYNGQTAGGSSVYAKPVGTAAGTCNSTLCHGVNSQTWTTVNSDATCVKCHGVVGTSPASYLTITNTAAPGYSGTGVNSAGSVGTITNGVSNDAKVGAHDSHLRGTKGFRTGGIVCTNCHAVTALNSPGHMDGSTTFAWSSLATKSGALIPTYAGGVCTNVYCHGAGTSSVSTQGTDTTPGWTLTTYLTGTAGQMLAADCNKCHQSPPVANAAFNHSGVTLGPGNCSGCHGHDGSGPTHIDGILQATSGDCVGCHNAVINTTVAQTVSGGSVTQRRNIVAEFANTWSHKRSASPSGTVTRFDCIICHMEGDPLTGNTTTFHRDGYVDLRDPDTGVSVKAVTGFNGTPGAYTQGASDLRFVQFTRNLSVTLESDPNWLSIASIQINFCLKCHDADGALSTAAQVSGGTALKPFNTTITGQVAPFNSNGNGNVVNVAVAFATTNAAYHPVMGRGNNSYVQGARTVSPYVATKTTGTNTQYGYLISCWDCHAAAGATGVQTGSVTAHGAAVTLRGTAYNGGTTAAVNLCLNCHATTYASTAGNHGAGSAFGTGGSTGNMPATTMQRCTYCHAYTAAVGGTNAYNLASRPLRAENAHGFNDRTPGTVGSTWTTSGVKPYAFIRNTLSVWAPARVGGVAPPSAHTCTGTGGTCNNNMNNSSYTPGGAY